MRIRINPFAPWEPRPKNTPVITFNFWKSRHKVLVYNLFLKVEMYLYSLTKSYDTGGLSWIQTSLDMFPMFWTWEWKCSWKVSLGMYYFITILGEIHDRTKKDFYLQLSNLLFLTESWRFQLSIFNSNVYQLPVFSTSERRS